MLHLTLRASQLSQLMGQSASLPMIPPQQERSLRRRRFTEGTNGVPKRQRVRNPLRRVANSVMSALSLQQSNEDIPLEPSSSHPAGDENPPNAASPLDPLDADQNSVYMDAAMADEPSPSLDMGEHDEHEVDGEPEQGEEEEEDEENGDPPSEEEQVDRLSRVLLTAAIITASSLEFYRDDAEFSQYLEQLRTGQHSEELGRAMFDGAGSYIRLFRFPVDTMSRVPVLLIFVRAAQEHEAPRHAWIIYVLGGTYPQDHPYLNGDPTVMVEELLKPQTCTAADLDAWGHIEDVTVTEEKCPICLEQYELGEKYRRLPCEHAFHRQCVDDWLLKGRNTCPMCRRTAIPGHAS